MSEIINSTYEIISEIVRKKGVDGGYVVVYLANHINLNKKIVLKADKRKKATRLEHLRREVDVMKNLSHTYIPQVYDFFVEDDIYYTAMEFIEGESLDIPLKRKEKFSQPQVIKWAEQLLEALNYLHKPEHGDPPKGYVHSDIKPGNLMRKPNNDICLIDFNIALALGEYNLVGQSVGYASPEHYGLDYSVSGSESASWTGTTTETAQTKRVSKSVSKSINPKSLPTKEKSETVVESKLEDAFHKPVFGIKQSAPLAKSDDTEQVTESVSDATEFETSHEQGQSETVIETEMDKFTHKPVSDINRAVASIQNDITELFSEVTQVDIGDDSEKTVFENNANANVLTPGAATVHVIKEELTEQPTKKHKMEKTEVVQKSKATNSHSSESIGPSVSSRRRIMPDVRSDIYMVGATLYHLLSGNRPAKDARDVIPLSKEEFSPQIVDIITKAMNPNPDLRYQTAEEMLFVFYNLHITDPDILKYEKHKKIGLIILALSLVLSIFTTFVGLKRIQTTQLWLNYVNYSNEAYQNGNAEEAVMYALKAIPDKNGIFIPRKIASAQLALTNALEIYDLSDGYKTYETIELPSELLSMTLSPNGKTALCMYAYEIAVINTDNCAVTDTLPIVGSALAESEYTDENTIIYAGADGITCYDIQKHSVVWSGNPATAIAVSADDRCVAAVYKDTSLATIYDTKNGSQIGTINFDRKKQRVTINDIFANPKDNIFELNQDGSLLGASFSDGSVTLFDTTDQNHAILLMDANEEYTHFEGGFYKNYFAFSASSKSGSVFAIINTDTMEQTGGFQSESILSVAVDGDGIRLQTDNFLVIIDPETGEQIPLVTTSDPIWRFVDNTEHTMTATKNTFSFFDKNAAEMSNYQSNVRPDFLQISSNIAMVGSMDSARVRILRYESQNNTKCFLYDNSSEYLEARIAHDWQTIMLFSYAQFSIFDKDGALLNTVAISDADQVYDQQFIRAIDCSYLEVTYNDGKRADYDAHSGEIIQVFQGEKPDLTLYEEFETESYRITCPLHGTPEVYDIDSGKVICCLDEDAYLTYVTQIEQYIVLQYITANGDRYGKLLNSDLEIVAHLPYLCDIIDEQLVFDYPSGYVCACQIYSLEQLVEMAEAQKGV